MFSTEENLKCNCFLIFQLTTGRDLICFDFSSRNVRIENTGGELYFVKKIKVNIIKNIMVG